MSQTAAATAWLHLVRDAATPLGLATVSGDRSARSEQAHEPARPYVRVSFASEHQPTDVPGLMGAVALLEVFAVDHVTAWAKAAALANNLGLNRGIVRAPDAPSDLSTYAWASPGFSRGRDPQGGGMVYGSFSLTYFA